MKIELRSLVGDATRAYTVDPKRVKVELIRKRLAGHLKCDPKLVIIYRDGVELEDKASLASCGIKNYDQLIYLRLILPPSMDMPFDWDSFNPKLQKDLRKALTSIDPGEVRTACSNIRDALRACSSTEDRLELFRGRAIHALVELLRRPWPRETAEVRRLLTHLPCRTPPARPTCPVW